MKKEIIFEKLKAPFSVDEICFKVNNKSDDKKRAIVSACITNSAIQERLDELFTPFGWQISFKSWKNENAQICTISVFDGDKWISKEDGDTNCSSIKNELSNSMERCAKMFGIGRYLDSKTIFRDPWVILDEYGNISENDAKRLKSEYNKFLDSELAAKTSEKAI